MPKVSIIVPVYNVEKYLTNCLNSIINQTLTDVEIICINDASTDNSLEILTEYAQKDDRIKIIDLKENQGIGFVRNTGLKMAEGKYIGFVDSDDWIFPETYETLYNQAEKLESEIVIFAYDRLWENLGKTTHPPIFREAVSSYKFKNNNVPAGGNVDKQYIYKTLLVSPCYCWNRLFLRKFLIDNNIEFPLRRCYEDVTFTIQTLLTAEKISYIDKPLYVYQTNESSLVQNGNSFIATIPDIYVDAKKYIESKNIPFDFELNLRYFLVMNIIWSYHKVDKKSQRSFYTKTKQLLPKEDIKYVETELQIGALQTIKKILNMLSSMLNIFFSISTTKNNKHKVLNIFGIKIKIRNKSRRT